VPQRIAQGQQQQHQPYQAAEGQDLWLGRQLRQLVLVVGMVQGCIKGFSEPNAYRQARQQQRPEEATPNT
jgi:hypothetical protein